MKTKKISAFIALVTIIGLAVFGMLGTTGNLQAASDSFFADLYDDSDIELSPFAVSGGRDLRTAPGTVRYVGVPQIEPITITVTRYNGEVFEVTKVSDPAAAREMIVPEMVTWIDVSGVHDEKIIKDFGSAFDLPNLIISDIANTGKQPQLEEYEDYIFVLLKAVSKNSDLEAINLEQVSLVLGPNFLLSFQEQSDDLFASVRDRIARQEGPSRTLGPDYLAFALVDTVVQSFFPAIQILNDQIYILENMLLDSPDDKLLTGIYRVKRELMFAHHLIFPTQEVVKDLRENDSSLLTPEVREYFQSSYENVVYLSENVNFFEQITSEMMNMYISSFSHRTNRVLTILTIISTIFLPITFIAGIYGINLSQFHPERKRKIWHIILFVAMVLMAVVMVLIFSKILNWI